MSDDIKWNRKKKDERDAEQARVRVKQAIGQVYADWKARMLTRKKLPKEDLAKYGKELRVATQAALAKFGFADDPFGQQTMQLLDAKLADIEAMLAADAVLATQTPFVNRLTRFLPPREDDQPQTPEVYEFHDHAELLAIPFVAAIVAKPDYNGLVREVNKLFAWLGRDELMLIGAVSTRVGIERVPTVAEVRDAKFVRKARN